MKKALSLGVAALCALGVSSVALAASDYIMTGEGNHTIEAEYTVASSYTVSIPASFTFAGATTSQDLTVTASDVFLSAGQAVKVSMSSENGALINTDNSQIPYQITLDGTTEDIVAEKQYSILNVSAGAEGLGGENTFTLTPKGLDQVTLAGRHADTLTFSLSVGSAARYAMLSTTPSMGDSIQSLGGTPSFRSEADIETFDHVEIDGQVVDPSNYTTNEGSTIVTLNAAYSLNLATGLHNIKIVTKSNDYAEADFEKTGTKRNVINFSIDGTPYIASEGMTWAEWVLSYGISSSCNNIVWFGFETPAIVYIDNTSELVSPHVNNLYYGTKSNIQHVGDVIVDGANYRLDGPA